MSDSSTNSGDFFECGYRKEGLTVFVAGASGDLAKKKTYPALLALFRDGYLPADVIVVGYARSPSSDDDFRAKMRKSLTPGGAEDGVVEAFLLRCIYRRGGYGDKGDVARVFKEVSAMEEDEGNRLFYFALPPSVFVDMARAIKEAGETDKGWNRYMIEKPFGSDLETFEELHAKLSEILPEEDVFRLDHYLGKGMIKQMLLLRFGNAIFEPLWNRNNIDNVQFTFKENFGTKGRGGFYDDIGVIRDVMQNHMMQEVALLAMEAPVRVSGDAIRDEKRKVLDCIAPVRKESVIVGQYTADDEGKTPAYTDDDSVPNDSKTATFGAMTLYVNNPRWEGVPFILRAGKALNETKSEIRVQFKRPPGSAMLFPKEGTDEVVDGSVGEETVARNELVIRLQPNQAMYVKLNVQAPSLKGEPIVSELDLSYRHRYPQAFERLPDAYTYLILQCLRGDNSSFLRADELRSAWRIFTPLLKAVDAGQLPLHKYKAGSRGPPEFDEMAKKAGYIHSDSYEWQPPAKL